MQHNHSQTPPINVDLNGLTLSFQSPDALLKERFELVYGHLPRFTGDPEIYIGWHIHKLPAAPPPPPGMPVILEDDFISYYGYGHLVAVRLPKYGLITVDMKSNRLIGAITRSCLESYGVFEDMLIISLAPIYRRRGWFPIHAFAALSPAGQAAIISGETGSGKTTTGLALLSAGWKLLSNDSPLLYLSDERIEVLAHPGRLSAFDDSLARFETLKRFIPTETGENNDSFDLMAANGPPKREFRVEEAFPDPWASRGMAGGVFFPQIEPELAQNELVEIAPTEAVLHLMPQAIEGWDREAIRQNLHLLTKLVAQAPCYKLRLSPDVSQLPEVISAGM